jgi:MFS family permease
MHKEVLITCIEEVDEIVDRGEIRTPRHKALLLLGLAGIAFEAFYLAVLSSGTAPMAQQLDLTANQVGLVSSYGYVATLVAALTCGLLADRLGRVKLMVIAKFVTCAALIIMGTAPSFLVLVFGRCVAGAAFGIDLGVAMAYLSEFLPKKRQHWLNLWQAQWFLSTVVALAVVLGLYRLDLGLNIWRWAMVVAGLLALVVAFGQLAVLPESPRWLARKGQLDALARSLWQVYRIDARFPDSGHFSRVSHVESERKWSELFASRLRRRTILVNFVIVLVAITYYAVAYYLPVIGLTLFGKDFGEAIVGSIIFNLFGIFGGFSSIWIARRIGARGAALYGFLAVAVMILIFGLCFHLLSMALVFIVPALFVFFYAAGPGTASLTMAAMAYPSEIRGRGGQLSAVSQSIGGIVGLYVFPNLVDAVGTSLAITIFGIAPLLGVGVCLLIRWEPFDLDVTDDIGQENPAFERA